VRSPSPSDASDEDYFPPSGSKSSSSSSSQSDQSHNGDIDNGYSSAADRDGNTQRPAGYDKPDELPRQGHKRTVSKKKIPRSPVQEDENDLVLPEALPRSLASITITKSNGHIPNGYADCTVAFIKEGVPNGLKAFMSFERGKKKGQLHVQGLAEFNETPNATGLRRVRKVLNEFYPMVTGRKITVKWCSGTQQLTFMSGYCQKVCFIVLIISSNVLNVKESNLNVNSLNLKSLYFLTVLIFCELVFSFTAT
jgi:hypothetical protein